MVDKLRKAFGWIWYNKERMVLVVMVAILCYRVYQVMNPPPEEGPTHYPPPITDTAQIPAEAMPPVPPETVPIDVPGNYSNLYRQNPFWYHSGDRARSEDKALTPEDLDIELLAIREVSGRWRAQLRTQTTRAWYDEGEEFEEFVLEQINPEQQSVVIYAARYAERLTLTMQ